MKLYNIISCGGFGEQTDKISFDVGGPCSSAKLVLVAIFFINAIVRKWLGEEIGIDYNFWGGLSGGTVGYIIPLTFTGNIGLSFIIGLVTMLVGGYGLSYIFGGDDDY